MSSIHYSMIPPKKVQDLRMKILRRSTSTPPIDHRLNPHPHSASAAYLYDSWDRVRPIYKFSSLLLMKDHWSMIELLKIRDSNLSSACSRNSWTAVFFLDSGFSS